MTTKHTAGKWLYNSHGASANEYSEAGNHHKWRWEVSTTREDGIDPEELKANARLIAAAPEMAEALRLAIDTIASLHGHYCPDCKGGCPDLETIAIGRAAIAKAEGL